ncbi:MAG: serine protease [Candidatus Electrothrix sp. AW5]|nr:serine protease [Candidatus Electrothrix gigas]
MTRQSDWNFADSFACICNHNKDIIGAGFLIGRKKIVTCAHVICNALRLNSTPLSAPNGDVSLSFPFFTQDRLSATVLTEGWDQEKDIALLQVNDDLPKGTQPAKLSFEKVENNLFCVYGFPENITKGVWAFGVIKKKREHGLVQLESANQTGYAVQRGFSGGPVLDDEQNKIVGMVATADLHVRVASMIPVDILSTIYNQIEKKINLETTHQDDKKNIFQGSGIKIGELNRRMKKMATESWRLLPRAERPSDGLKSLSGVISEYVTEHKKTVTFQKQLVTYKEYKVERKWGGLRTVFPALPKAGDEHDVLIMNFKGTCPSIADVLTKTKIEIGDWAQTNELTNYLFIFVKIKPQLLSISSPDGEYQLGDGHKINATIDVTYRIRDIRDFWLSGDDPLALFQRTVINKATEFFFNITSQYLIRKPIDSKASLESYIHEYQQNVVSEIELIKDSLKKDIKEGCTSSGIEIIKVYADVQLNDNLNNFLKRLHEKFFGDGGVVDKISNNEIDALVRKQVDERINNDMTFHPYNLREVITALDIGLLENFYNLPWAEAIQKLHDEIRKKKKSYISDHKRAKIDGIKELLKIAKEEDVDNDYVEILKDKLIREMNTDQEQDNPLVSDRHSLQLIMTQQVEDTMIPDDNLTGVCSRAGVNFELDEEKGDKAMNKSPRAICENCLKIDRSSVDERIDEDKTFAPYNLRSVIMSLDTGLLENFYCMDWTDAIKKVHEELSIQKKAYLGKQNKTLIDEYQNRLTRAKDLELDEIHIQDLKDKLADLLIQDPANTFQMTSNNQFLQQKIDNGSVIFL